MKKIDIATLNAVISEVRAIPGCTPKDREECIACTIKKAILKSSLVEYDIARIQLVLSDGETAPLLNVLIEMILIGMLYTERTLQPCDYFEKLEKEFHGKS